MATTTNTAAMMATIASGVLPLDSNGDVECAAPPLASRSVPLAVAAADMVAWIRCGVLKPRSKPNSRAKGAAQYGLLEHN